MKTFASILSAIILLHSSNIYSEVDSTKRINTIEQEITNLKSDKKLLKSKAMELKHESYNVMAIDWEKYSRLLKKIENYQHMTVRIDKRIKELNSEKIQISKMSSPTS